MMKSSEDNKHFHVQHKNKCYCQNKNLCYCTGIEDSSKNSNQSSHKFIKVRSDKGKQNKSVSLCSTNSFSPTPTLMMNSISASSMTTTTGTCYSESKLTCRREDYEKSKARGFDVRTWNIEEHIRCPTTEHLNLICDEEIMKLQEFRLQNADECLSSGRRYSIIDKTNQLGKSKEASVEGEGIKYTLNNRGLLKIIGSNDDSPAAIVVHSKAAVKDILRQKLKSSNAKDKLIRKALCLPENSLALRYQKTY